MIWTRSPDTSGFIHGLRPVRKGSASLLGSLLLLGLVGGCARDAGDEGSDEQAYLRARPRTGTQARASTSPSRTHNRTLDRRNGLIASGDGSTDVRSGTATFYDYARTASGRACNATVAGCGYRAAPPSDYIAVNTADFGRSQMCGACVEVKGPKGTAIGRVVDECPSSNPDCVQGHLDMSRSLFNKISRTTGDERNITWRVVPCGSTSPISYQIKDGTNPWWGAFVVLNHNKSLKTVEIWRLASGTSRGRWQALTRQGDNNFIAEQGFGASPVKVRLTPMDGGDPIEDTIRAEMKACTTVAGGGVQF